MQCEHPAGTCLDCTVLSIAEAARHCQVRAVTIRQWIARGHLAPRRVERRTYVLKRDLLLCELARRTRRVVETAA